VLAGRPPYQVMDKTLAEAARIIHDAEPTRLRTAVRDIPADVDTIVSKALEKEKDRRYSSAADLAEDIRRFLRDDPIVARAPSAGYQVRKFARRHKALVAGVLASFVLLLAGVITTSWQAVRASRAEQAAQARAQEAETARAQSEAVTTFVTDMLASVDPAEARGRDVSVREALDAAAKKIDAGAMAKQPAVEIAVRNAIGSTYAGLGLLDAAETQLRAAAALEARTGATAAVRGDTQAQIVSVMYAAGKYPEAEAAAREALRLRREAYGPNHADVAQSLDDLGAILMARRLPDQAEPMMREAVAMKKRLLPAGDPKIAVSLNNLGYLLWSRRKYQDAESAYREALASDRQTLGADHPEIATRLINLAVLYRDWGRPDEMEPLAREALAIRRKVLGPEHPEITDANETLATALELRGEHREAESLLRDALALSQRIFGEVNLHTARLQHSLAFVLWKEGKYAEAAPHFRLAVTNIPKTYGPTYRGGRLSVANLAHNLNGLGDHRAAESTAREALAAYRQVPSDELVVSPLVALGDALAAQGRYSEAEPLLREARATAEKNTPVRYPWLKGQALSSLGAVSAARHEADAEQLLLDGYESLHAAKSTPPPLLRASITRLVAFYTAAGKRQDAARWRARLD
jgi:tetratricopeptide (TPR) repeat protein